MTYSLLCIGNPLLDMQVRNGEKLLEKYGLKANDAILADEKQAGMYDLFFFFASWILDTILIFFLATMNWLMSIK